MRCPALEAGASSAISWDSAMDKSGHEKSVATKADKAQAKAEKVATASAAAKAVRQAKEAERSAADAAAEAQRVAEIGRAHV